MALSELTRKELSAVFADAWHGRAQPREMFKRLGLSDVTPKESYKTFSDEIFKRWEDVNADDWDESPLLDLRFVDTDEKFFQFMTEALHPVVVKDSETAATLRRRANNFLLADGFEIVETARMSGRAVYSVISVPPRVVETGAFSTRLLAFIAEAMSAALSGSKIDLVFEKLEVPAPLQPWPNKVSQVKMWLQSAEKTKGLNHWEVLAGVVQDAIGQAALERGAENGATVYKEALLKALSNAGFAYKGELFICRKDESDRSPFTKEFTLPRNARFIAQGGFGSVYEVRD